MPPRAGRGTWAEIKAAAESRMRALDGDTRMLEERRRQGIATLEELEVAADLLASKKKSGGQARLRVQWKRQDAALWMRHAIQCSGWPDKKIVLWAKDHYRLSRTEAYEIFQEVKRDLSG
jgi:hypothetical protein